jgi:hypothetical protein
MGKDPECELLNVRGVLRDDLERHAYGHVVVVKNPIASWRDRMFSGLSRFFFCAHQSRVFTNVGFSEESEARMTTMTLVTTS